MKKTLINILKSIIFLLLLGLAILAAIVILKRKDSDYKYTDFFNEAKKDNIDVLFMGSSHVINAINPVFLFEDYGITSYNMGGHGAMLQATYWELKEALEYCTPKWVVVDAYMLEKNIRYLDNREEFDDEDEVNTAVEQLHLNMDAWPLNDLKREAIDDLIQRKSVKNEFLYEFIIYHNRWKYLNENDFKTITGTAERNHLFGAEMRYDVELEPEQHPDVTEADLLTEDTVGTEYLEKIIELCQDKGINVVTTFIPFAAGVKDKAAAIRAGEISEMYDVPYINMLEEDVIDVNTDLNDRSHLNVVGAKKVSDYMGQWLSDTGDLTDHRGDDRYAYWQQCVEDFNEELDDVLFTEDNLYIKLDLLCLEDYNFVLYVNDGSPVFLDDYLKRMVIKSSMTNKIDTTTGPYILVKDNSHDKMYEASEGDSLSGMSTALGTLNYQPVEHYFRLLYSDEDQDTNYLYDDIHYLEDIQLIIYDEDGEILEHDYYKSNGTNYVR
ncbi:hypothetical protein [Butyrivibrio sp. AE2015]|uniref:hypothetical protein n=1 Tax=Butyrivibrio sp. AE2015 TaxID=1280663 RepID=UPI0003B7225F|nr:hypothetical protein [Butyrivibrio sp. AE2015]